MSRFGNTLGIPLVFMVFLLFVSCDRDEMDTIGPLVVDYDGNIYKSVIIGDNVWMAENLKVTHYADGTPIPLVEDSIDWSNLSVDDKAYCYHDNDPVNGTIYGAIYTWAAASNRSSGSDLNPSGIQGVCPTGWHLPSDTEWEELIIYLGDSLAGGKLKEALFSHWRSPNTGADNSSGFTALPGGSRLNTGGFSFTGNFGFWWTATSFDYSHASLRSMFYKNSMVRKNELEKDYGLSVRCLKD